jgi:pimeloyl-ACP methyl ester carboxylesterase
MRSVVCRGKRKASLRLAVVILGMAGALLGAPGAHAQTGFDQNPVLFVHGIEGTGAQFESQKMRFMSNGYPERWIDVVDYDSTRAVGDKSEVHGQIDRAIGALKQRTGRAKVDVVAHSLGTSVMYDYLTKSATAEQRKASVGRYVNVDGQTSNPGVPTLALFAGRGEPGRKMDGATNVTIPNQTHVQVCTSAEAFVEYFKFLTGKTPAHDIVPESGRVSIAGRALLFPQNKALPAGVTLEIWPVADDTGKRLGNSPTARVSLPESGDFGPLQVDAGRRYEFVLLRPGIATLHYYYEPFVRSDHLVRLPYSDAVEAAVQRGERHVSGLVIRYKELWGNQGTQNDVLSINGTSVCNEAICPITKQVNALFFFDRGMDGRTDLSRPDPAFSALPFITAVDLFAPASRPPTGTTSVSLKSRGGGPARTLSFPNFPSTTEGSVLQFNDFERPVASRRGRTRRGCLNSRRGARGKRLGPARLGRTRSSQRRRLRGKRLRDRPGIDRYCATGGGSFRIGYPTARLSPRQRAVARGRAILVLTSSRRFKVAGVRAGSGVRALRRRLRGERRFRVGRNVWFLARGRAATHAYKTRGRKVLAVGIADRRMTHGARASKRLLRSWELRGGR